MRSGLAKSKSIASSRIRGAKCTENAFDFVAGDAALLPQRGGTTAGADSTGQSEGPYYEAPRAVPLASLWY